MGVVIIAWVSPRTWSTGELVTSALANTHWRDNLLETAPAKVTAAGDIVYGTGANALARLAIGASPKVLTGGASAPSWANPTLFSGTTDVTADESTTSSSYTDLTTAGPAVTLTPGETMEHLIMVQAYMQTSVAGTTLAYMSPSIAGGAAADVNAALTSEVNRLTLSRTLINASVASGSTHTAKYRAFSGTAQFSNRRLLAIAL